MRGDDRRAPQHRPAQHGRHRACVQRRRHHHDQQIRAQGPADFPGQRQTQIGVQRAFVEFVKDHRADARQFGVRLNHPGQNTFGHHLDPRGARNPGFASDAVADGLTDRFAQRLGHAFGGGAGRQPARFQHQDAPRRQAGIQHRQRHPRGLAGTGRGLQYRAPPLGQGGHKVGKNCVNGQLRRHSCPYRRIMRPLP